MTTKPTIFLDIDGVAANFCKKALEVWDRPDLYPNMADVEVVLGLKDAPEVFWSRIYDYGIKFWTELEEYSWFQDLYSRLSDIAKVVFLTAPPRSADACAGKVLWLQKRFGSDFRDFIITNKKYYLKYHPKAVLIDDQEKNTDHWKDRAILFPQPWNKKNRLPNPDSIVDEICAEVEQKLSLLTTKSIKD